MKKKDGTLLECIETATVLRDDRNNIVGYHGTIKDITDRKRMETMIINSRDRLMTAFDAVSDRMYIVDDEYRVKFVNSSISEELDLDFDKLLNNRCYSFLNTKNEPCTGCPVSNVIENREGTSGDVFVGPEGEGSRFFVSAYPIKSEGDRHDFLIYSRDVTEEKRMEENLIQHDRLVSLGRLSAGVAHEINNPLTAILGYTQLLLKNIGDERREHEDLKLIEEQVLNCKTILDNLLIFSRSKVDRREYFILEDVLANVIMLNKKELKEKKIKVTKKFKNKIPTFHGDKIKITQVFLNILQNSIYAVDVEGKITVETSWDEVDNRVMITFMDNGPGISEVNIRRIFDPFFTTKPPGKGTGLGLSVSYGIVREHGGVIVAESPPGKGAKFIVFLPIKEETPG
jgi:two-component system NtrC family sensor kinase